MSGFTIVVYGATGRLRQLTPTLLEHGHRVRAATRDPAGPAAATLATLGAQVVRADYDDPDSLTRAAQGADVIFTAGSAHAAGQQGDIRHGRNVADAARAAGVGHLVYLSVAGAAQPTRVPLFESKRVVEEYLRRAGVPSTVVAPVYFMENLWNAWNRPALAAGRLPGGVPVDRPVQQVCLADVIAFTALVIERRDQFVGGRVEIAADELTAQDAAAVVSRLVGRPVEAVGPVPAGGNPLFDWLDRVGDHVDIAAVRARYPEIGWHDFAGWAAGQDWRVLAPASR
jgi:uncharacterized protein YbjT (DUF2867 family)